MRVIVFELNEVPWRVLDWYVERNPASTFAKVASSAEVYTTVSEDAGELYPWVTWPSLHRGVNNQLHGITHLGQDLRPADEEFPAVWRILADHGVEVGLSGSLQSFPAPAVADHYAFYIPDTYALEPDTIPPQLSQLQALNLRLTKQNSRNVSSKLTPADAIVLASEFVRRGGRAATAKRIVGQLAGEISDRSRLNRRRGIQAAIQFDVFLRRLNMQKPEFCTFFSNHVAASMHRYWAASFPEDYRQMGLPKPWLERYAGELEWAMDLADDFLRELAGFCARNPSYRLLIASSMGQAATQAETRNGYYSITQPERFLGCLGIDPGEVRLAMAMAPDVSAHLLTPVAAERFRASQPMLERAFPDIELDLDEQGMAHIRLLIPHDVEHPMVMPNFGNRLYTPDEAGIGFVPDQDQVGVTAYHVPEGVLLNWSPGSPPQPRRRPPLVSSLEIAPAVLRAYGVRPPRYMADPSFSI
jgi:hypothetical protein